ncbi:chaperone NapD [Lutibacter sp.]|uniref:chaperone NapD n=1 Tax=Lutibacter sp. TaxID=1925666 RepID=UPI0025C2BE02|nr:chaperone NapD [Lutibacter sp.]MCF6168744.1 chaperone NapD [Lutibacter sp.]
MPIKSYVLHYEESKREELVKGLQKLQGCEIIPAQNHAVIVLVTETETEELDNKLYHKLLEIKGLKHVSLVSGFDTK